MDDAVTRQERPADRLRAGEFTVPEGFDRIFERAADIALMLDADGTVLGVSVNPDADGLGCLDHWVGRPLTNFLNIESAPKFASRLKDLRDDAVGADRPLELNHVDNGSWEFPVRYTVHSVDDDGGYLMLGRDLQPFAEIQQRLVREQHAHERDQERLRGAETRFRVVLEASETPLVVVDLDTGRISEINSAASLFLGSEPGVLAGTSFAKIFEGRRRGELFVRLKEAAAADSAEGIDVVVQRNRKAIRIVPEFFRASGEVLLLCRFVPIEEEADAATDLVQALVAMFEASSDAIVLTDAKGTITDCNESFLSLVDAITLGDVRERSISDFFARGSVDLKLILENATKRGRMRNYSAQVQGIVGTRVQAEVSAARLGKRSAEPGFGFIIRSVAYRDAVEDAASSGAISDDAVQNVMDLVGTASLKDLVSATTDVIEKLCIETALRLTENNRVAAAEMLGLSRQSLYVKLNKYGMQERGSGD